MNKKNSNGLNINFFDKLAEKNIDDLFLIIIFIFEVAVVLFIAIGVLPREFSWPVTAVIIFYIIGAKIKYSLDLTILSIPFYLALPVSSGFDTMANWRLIFAALVLAWLAKEKIIQKISQKNILSPKNLKEFFQKNPLYSWLLLFVTISVFSLIGSSEIIIGIKKILFLANIFILFFVVKNTVTDKKSFIEALKISVFAGLSVLLVAYFQIIATFFYALFQIWQFWAKNIVAALYGQNLSVLLTYANTWFSYYPGEIPPTLRMFSVFPDSHSFALFNIILLPFVTALIWHYKKNNNELKIVAYSVILIAALLAIILSGSRGAWLSAIIPFAIALFIVGKEKIKNIAGKIRTSIKQKTILQAVNSFKNFGAKLKNSASYLLERPLRIILSTMILFFVLFPFSSFIIEQTQIAEWKRLNSGGDIQSMLLLKRIKSIIDLDELSNKSRIEIWKDTLRSIKKHPVLGVGIGNFPEVLGKNISAGKKGASAHNLFLDIFSEMGILGLMAFLGIFYQIAKRSSAVFSGNAGSNENSENSGREVYLHTQNENLKSHEAKNNQNRTHKDAGGYKIFSLSFAVYLSWILGYALFDVVLFNDKVLMLFTIALGLLYGIKSNEFETEN